jgi:hypothetical protein
VRGISLGVVGWKARPPRREAARAWKSHWLVMVLKAYDGRSAIEATGEPSGRDRRNQGAKIPEERPASIGMSEGVVVPVPSTTAPVLLGGSGGAIRNSGWSDSQQQRKPRLLTKLQGACISRKFVQRLRYIASPAYAFGTVCAQRTGRILNSRHVPAEAPVGLAAAVPNHAAIVGLAFSHRPAVDARNVIHSLGSYRFPVPKQQ